MNIHLFRNRSLIFLILFSIVYLLGTTGKINPWMPAHFNFFVLIISVFVGLYLFNMEGKYGRRWIWPLLFLLLLLLVYLTWFPKTLGSWLPVHFNLSALIVTVLLTFYVLHRNTQSRDIKIIQYIIMGYILLVLLSSVMHYVSLQMIDPSTYVTVRKHTVSFALHVLDVSLRSYLFFPLLLLLTIQLFISDYNIYKRLYLLSLIFIPSIIVAIYQAYVDIDFLNIPFFARMNRVSGLGHDANSFALSIYLLFPLAFLSILLQQIWLKKILFILLPLVLIWCMLLSGSRTGLFGLLLFFTILPWIWAWASESISKNKRRFLMCFPLIFVISIFTIGVISLQMNPHPSSTLGKRLLSSYHDFKEGGIKRLDLSRSHLWLQAYRLTKESPISGWGPGGFKRNLDNVRFRYGENPRLRYLDNATNHYLQMSSELGLLGAFLNLFLILFPLWMVFRIRNRIENREERWAAGITFSTIFIMMLLFITGPHTMPLDVLWLFAVLLGFLFATGIRYGYSIDTAKMKWAAVVFICFMGMFFLRTYDHTFGLCGYKAMQNAEWWPLKYERNCYAIEYWDGEKFRWCGKDAFLRIPIRKTIPDKVKLKFLIQHPDIEKRPVIFKYGGKDGATHELIIKDISWNTIEIPVTPDNIYEFKPPNKPAQKYFVVYLDVSRTWIPKELGVNNDTRALGVAVMIPDL